MPLVKVEIYQQKSKEYKRAIFEGIHAALVAAFKIPVDDRNQGLYELAEENFERKSNKSENFTIIEILAFKGRSFEAKKLLYDRNRECNLFCWKSLFALFEHFTFV